MKRREFMKYGYRTFTGKRVSDLHAQTYNAIQARINSFLDAGIPVPEHLLNSSHKLFSLVSA